MKKNLEDILDHDFSHQSKGLKDKFLLVRWGIVLAGLAICWYWGGSYIQYFENGLSGPVINLLAICSIASFLVYSGLVPNELRGHPNNGISGDKLYMLLSFPVLLILPYGMFLLNMNITFGSTNLYRWSFSIPPPALVYLISIVPVFLIVELIVFWRKKVLNKNNSNDVR